jgi:hypothetical protein
VPRTVAKVPKVTKKTRREELELPLFPPSCGADQAVGNHAEPEIEHQSPIQLKRPVPWEMEGGREKEVGNVAQDDGAESLNQVDQHGRLDTEFTASEPDE